MDKIKKAFTDFLGGEASKGRMSSEDGQDQPTTTPKSTSGVAGILRNLSTARPKSHTPPAGGDNTTELSSQGRLSRTVSRGTGDGGKISPATSMSGQRDAPNVDKILQDISPEQLLSVRQDAAELAGKSCQFMSYDQTLELTQKSKDLLSPFSQPETRQAIFTVIQYGLEQSNGSLKDVHRSLFFDLISTDTIAEELPIRLNLLIDLVNKGKNSSLSSVTLIPLLSSWIDQWYTHIEFVRKEQKRTRSDGTTVRTNSTPAKLAAKLSVGTEDPSSFPRLFSFICSVLSDDTYHPSEQEMEELLLQVQRVCKRATKESDIENSITVFDAALAHASIPDQSLGPCIDVLSGTYFAVKPLTSMSWNSISSLLKSNKQKAALQKMYQFLTLDDVNLNLVRGLISIFGNLITIDGAQGLPIPDYYELLRSLNECLKRDLPKLEADILELCNGFFEKPAVCETLKRDFSMLFTVIRKCSRRIVLAGEKIDEINSTPATSAAPRHSNVLEDLESATSKIAHNLETSWDNFDASQKYHASAFMMDVYRLLNNSEAELLAKYYIEEGLKPGNGAWSDTVKNLIRDTYTVAISPSASRIFALTVFQKAYMANESWKIFNQSGILDDILYNLPTEADPLVFQVTMDFLVDAAMLYDMESFDGIGVPDCLVNCTKRRPQQRRGSLPQRRPSSADVLFEPESSMQKAAASSLVQVFLRSLNASTYSAEKSASTFDRLLTVASSVEAPSEARLVVLKLLFRLRSDSNSSIFVISESESEHLAAALCRTVETENTLKPREESSNSQGARSSVGQPPAGLSRSGTRGGGASKAVKRTPPLWLYPEPKDLPEEPSPIPSLNVFSSFNLTNLKPSTGPDGRTALKINQWLELVIRILQREEDWEISSYVLVHLGSQLMNTCLFTGSVLQIKLLRNVLCDQIFYSKYHEPPGYTGLRKSDVSVCIFNAITVLVSYRSQFGKSEQDDLVRSLMYGLGSGDGTSRSCIHALSICCHEVPGSMAKMLPTILEKMGTIITQSHIAVHILEFLSELARLPDLYVNLRTELRTVFGICVRYLQSAREQRAKVGGTSSVRTSYASRHSGSVREFSALSESAEASSANDLPQYVYALTYHVMIFWFLSLKLEDRANHVNWITKSLVWSDESNKEVLEEQSEVFIDMMQRTAYSDLGDTVPHSDITSSADGPVQKKSWLIGMSILTLETAGSTGLTLITKRQASGTTHSTYQQHTAERLPHHIPLSTNIRAGTEERVSILPSHVLLQLTSSAFPTYVEMQPIPLPGDDATGRAIRQFDRNDIVDGHKVGIVYVGQGQTDEVQILANTSGSADYDEFLKGLGTKVDLRGARFNVQGLDKESDGDGKYTLAWRDRVTEIVYHVATMMPTDLEMDSICARKKSHIGNDFVTIVFNESNLPFKFDTIRSQFNYVNIVITPASRLTMHLTDDGQDLQQDEKPMSTIDESKVRCLFYKVQVVSKPGFPKVSPAAEPKLLSAGSLPEFVRLISLNASVFSLVWSNREGGEHISSWRNRLRAIRQLRERTLQNIVKQASEEAAGKGVGSAVSGRRTSAYPEGGNARLKQLTVASGYPDVDNLVNVMDFSGWTE